MKYLNLILILLPNLLYGYDVKVNCDFGMIDFYGNKIDVTDQSYTIFSLEYEIKDNFEIQISDFNLSDRFKSNFKILSKNRVIINNDPEKLFPSLINLLEPATNNELNEGLKKWLLPQLQKYTDREINNQFIILSTILENGVVINNIINKKKLSKNSYNSLLKLDVVLADGKFSFNGNCDTTISSESSRNKKNHISDREIDCFTEYDQKDFPEYCSSKILETYSISESEDGSIFIPNEKQNDDFLEICRKSTLDSLDRDVAILCLEKMNE